VLPLTVLGPDAVVDWLRWWLMALAVALTVVTGGDYVLRALRLARQGPGGEAHGQPGRLRSPQGTPERAAPPH